MSPDIHRFAVPPGPRYSDSHTTCSLRKSPVMAAMAMAQCWDPWPYDSSDSKKQGDPSSHRILRTSECVGGGIPHFVACKNPDLGPNQIRLQSKPLGCIASELSNSYATIAIIHNYSPVCCLYNPSVLTTYSWLQVHSIPMFAGISSPDTVGGKSQCGDLLRKLTIDATRAIRSQDSQMLQPSHAGDDPQKKSEKASFTIFLVIAKKKKLHFQDGLLILCVPRTVSKLRVLHLFGRCNLINQWLSNGMIIINHHQVTLFFCDHNI